MDVCSSFRFDRLAGSTQPTERSRESAGAVTSFFSLDYVDRGVFVGLTQSYFQAPARLLMVRLGGIPTLHVGTVNNVASSTLNL